LLSHDPCLRSETSLAPGRIERRASVLQILRDAQMAS